MSRSKPKPAARPKRTARLPRPVTGNAAEAMLVPSLLANLRSIAAKAGLPLELLLRECLGAARMEANLPPPDGHHAWDTLVAQLMEAAHEVFGQHDRVSTEQPRQKVGALLGQRVMGRASSLTTLFRVGMYSEAVPIVRAAYEDWLIASYLLLQEGDEPCRDFWYEDQQRLLAKTYRGFSKLLTEEVVRHFFSPSDRAKFEKYATGTESLSPLGGARWDAMAKAVGLENVHEGTYAILSGLSHGSALNADLSFGPGVAQGAGRPHLFLRDEDREHQFAVWSYWFMLRTLTLAGKQFGHDLEPKSSEVLSYVREMPPHITNAVVVREQWIGPVASKKKTRAATRDAGAKEPELALTERDD